MTGKELLKKLLNLSVDELELPVIVLGDDDRSFDLSDISVSQASDVSYHYGAVKLLEPDDLFIRVD